MDDTFEILSDGRTCWVNGVDGGAIGRWSPRGSDVHRTATEQLAGASQCIECVPTATWADFREAMKRHYGVILDEGLIRPEFRK